MSQSDSNYAVYVRRSTEEQEDEHQLDDIHDWFDYQDIKIGDVDVYREQGSGASEDRDEFLDLIEQIEDEQYTDVVVWELSRIARKTRLAARFFDAAEESGVTIHVTNGSIRKVEPDGHGRMVAEIISAVAAEERRQLIRRTKSGQSRARSEGKWIGQVPAGFTVSDGYLTTNLDPDYEDGESGYLDIVDAIERLDDGESYRSVAEDTPNVTRQTLGNIDQDEDRRSWYVGNGEPDDGRVAEAVTDIELD